MSARRPRNSASGRPASKSAKRLDASQAAITLAMICTREQLEEMERRALALQLEQKTSA
jgi:hypothetical protein